jgi:OmpR family two-component system bacitracin resistance sensor histidine kinase BceS
MENDYIASWVHEIKAPLTAMKLTIDANQSDPVMRKMEAEWLRIYLLVDRQLYITRLPALESDYVLEETAIQRLAAKEVRDLASWCMEKNIAVEFEGQDSEVITDIKWCRFIIRQLLMNAVKYSPKGGTLLISTEIMQAGNVILSIRDEGPGIPAHDLPRIFDKGFTGGNGRIYNAATGLGLYLARNIAAKIGISLEARSDQTKGTVMRMNFTTKNDFEAVRK